MVRPIDTVENWFRGIPVWLPDPERRAPEQTQFRLDVSENEKEYRVLAELPGVKKEEISITINGNEVAVAAEVKHEKDVKNGETVLCAERYYGRIQRALRSVTRSTKRAPRPGTTMACWSSRCRRKP
jgi:HSP20 family protein